MLNTQSMPSQRVPALDILRFLAAFGVMLYHFVSHQAAADGSVSLASVLTQHGFLGVDVFFMISGFVIFWSALGRTGAGFIRARVLRLYPEFWIAVTITAVTWAFVFPGWFSGIDTLYKIAINLTMAPGPLGAEMVDSVYWTLFVELKFYALVWLLVVAGQVGRMEFVLYGWLSVLAVATFIDVGALVRSVTLHPFGAYFAAGGLFYLVYIGGWTKMRAVAIAVALALCVHSSITRMPGFMDAARVDLVSQGVTAAIIVTAFALFASLRTMKRFAWPSWVALVGSLTYPLYLTHSIGKEIIVRGPVAEHLGWASHLVGIVFSLALAWLVMTLAKAYVAPVLKRVLDAIGLREGPKASGARPASVRSA